MRGGIGTRGSWAKRRGTDAALESLAMSPDAVESVGGRGAEGPRPPQPEQDQTPYLDAILAYAQRGPGRFHVPGHKGGYGADPAAIEAFGPSVFDRDIPAGIEGIDVGPDPPSSARNAWLRAPGAPNGAGSWSTAPPRATTRLASRFATPGAASSCSETSTRARSTGSCSRGSSPASWRRSSTPSSGSRIA